MKKRTIYLDIIRVIACFMVIVMHSPMPNGGSHVWVMVGYITAVCCPLFFMVSGALLLPCKGDLSACTYLKKRIGKILGPTLCFSLFYIALNGSWASVFSIPFSAQGHGILWFMYTLTGLYLLVPIISPWLRSASKRDLELYFVLWFITMLYPYIGIGVEVNTESEGVLYYFTGYAGYFLLGHYLSRYQVKLWAFLPLSLLMIPLPILNKVLGWNLDFFEAFWYLSAPVAIMTAAWFCGIKKFFKIKSEFVSELFVMVSNLSFGIYLIHIFVMRTLLWNWSVIVSIQNVHIQTILIIVLTFCISLAMCWLIAKLPFAQYIIGYKHKK